MRRRQTFVVFADDWGRHPSSCQHLFRRIAPHHRVVWVNTIGTRMPTLSRADLARVAEKLREWMGGGEEVDAPEMADVPVEVLRPLMTPFDRWRPLRALNARLLTQAIREALGPDDRPILVTTIPNAAGVVGQIGEAASVYYCVDEFSEWPGADRQLMIDMEGDLLSSVDLVVATAERLFEDKSARHPTVRLLKHGVDWDRFRAGEGTVPEELEKLPRPIVGSTGLIDERIDAELVATLARERPDHSFVFVGPRQLGASPLDAEPNVHFLPSVAYGDVPAVLQAFDVAFLPYVESELTERINPLKLREFLASGTPVVATPLREVRAYDKVLAAVRGAGDWLRAIDRAVEAGGQRAEEQAQSVRDDGWDRRAEEFLRYCEEAVQAAAKSTVVVGAAS